MLDLHCGPLVVDIVTLTRGGPLQVRLHGRHVRLDGAARSVSGPVLVLDGAGRSISGPVLVLLHGGPLGLDYRTYSTQL